MPRAVKYQKCFILFNILTISFVCHCIQAPSGFIWPIGHVLRLFCAADPNEHASGVPHHHHRSPWRAAVQLLSPLVWCHLPGQCSLQHTLPLSGPQTGTREAYGTLNSCLLQTAAGQWCQNLDIRGKNWRGQGLTFLKQHSAVVAYSTCSLRLRPQMTL